MRLPPAREDRIRPGSPVEGYEGESHRNGGPLPSTLVALPGRFTRNLRLWQRMRNRYWIVEGGEGNYLTRGIVPLGDESPVSEFLVRFVADAYGLVGLG